MPDRPTSSTPTCFGGALRRVDGAWRWLDGAPEPRMRDIPSCDADPDWRAGADGEFIEVPLTLAETFDCLGWLLDGVSDGTYDVDVSSGVVPALGAIAHPGRGAAATAAGIMRILVPREEWLRWCRECPILPVWEKADEADLQLLAMRKRARSR